MNYSFKKRFILHLRWLKKNNNICSEWMARYICLIPSWVRALEICVFILYSLSSFDVLSFIHSIEPSLSLVFSIFKWLRMNGKMLRGKCAVMCHRVLYDFPNVFLTVVGCCFPAHRSFEGQQWTAFPRQSKESHHLLSESLNFAIFHTPYGKHSNFP